MRTTLDIDDDVLQAARELALTHSKAMGKVVSELIRKALAPARTKVRVRNGVPLLAMRSQDEPLVTLELVNELRDQEA
jgi:hypothetical protein